MKRKSILATLTIVSLLLTLSVSPVVARDSGDGDRDSDSDRRWQSFEDRDSDEGDRDRDGDRGRDGDDRVDIDLRGTVESLGPGSIVIDGKTYVINSDTEIEGKLAVGSVVEIEAAQQSGSAIAREIEVKRSGSILPPIPTVPPVNPPATTPPPATNPPPVTIPPTAPPPTTSPPATIPPTTPPPAPILTPPAATTSAADSITTGDAVLNGSLGSLGTAASVTVAFEWGTSTAYGNTTTTQVRTTTGTFSAVLFGLSPETTYYFRAKASGDGTRLAPDRHSRPQPYRLLRLRLLRTPTTLWSDNADDNKRPHTHPLHHVGIPGAMRFLSLTSNRRV